MATTETGNFPPTETPEADKVWEPIGWYVARWMWNEKDAQRWHSLGYKVRRSTKHP